MTRRFQFSLRALLAAMTVLGIAIGFEANRTLKQRRIAEAIERLGGAVSYSWEVTGVDGEYRRPGVIRKLVGKDLCAHIYAVGTVDTGDEVCEYLERIPTLKAIVLQGPRVTDDGLERLQSLTQLDELMLGNTSVTDAGLEKLATALPNCTINRYRYP
jgi:hypothetical protein